MHAAQANYLLSTRSVESRSFNGSDRRRNGKTTTTTTTGRFTIVSILSFDSSIDSSIDRRDRLVIDVGIDIGIDIDIDALVAMATNLPQKARDWFSRHDLT